MKTARWYAQGMLCLVTLWPLAGSGVTSTNVIFPDPPRLATTAGALAALKASPGFEAVRATATNQAEAFLKKPVTVPDGFGDWYFYYANPKNGHRLEAKSPTEHIDRSTGEVFTDERTVASYRGRLHDEANNAALQLAWAYAYTGDDRYATETRRILMKLADDYHTYPGRRDRWGHYGLLAPLGGRRYTQSLDEAYTVIILAKAYDLSRLSKVWSDADRRHVETDFFRATADTLLRFNQDINNHQTWYNAGLVCIASVLADREMLDHVLNMRGGYYDQLQRSIGDDGLWYEGTMAYHKYALLAMMELTDAGDRLGLKLKEEPRLQSMIMAPFKAAYPNGQFPAINDSDRSDVNLFRECVNWAFGKDHPIVVETNSINMAAAGLAILRRGTGTNAVCVMVDYGPHGEGHGHYDKLNLMVYANGREWLLDPGRLSYSVGEYKTWVKTTAAHNTVTLRGASQMANTGTLLGFTVTNDYVACETESKGSYLDSTLRRYDLLTDQILVDIFDVETFMPSQIDWFAHAVSDGVEHSQTNGQARLPGTSDGYQYLTPGRVITPPVGLPWDFVAGKGTNALRLRLWFADPQQEQVFVTQGIGYSLDQKVPCLIRRRTAARTRFVTVFDLSGTGGTVRKAFTDPAGDLVTVETGPGVPAFTVRLENGTLQYQRNPLAGKPVSNTPGASTP